MGENTEHHHTRTLLQPHMHEHFVWAQENTQEHSKNRKEKERKTLTRCMHASSSPYCVVMACHVFCFLYCGVMLCDVTWWVMLWCSVIVVCWWCCIVMWCAISGLGVIIPCRDVCEVSEGVWYMCVAAPERAMCDVTWEPRRLFARPAHKVKAKNIR